MNDVKELYKTYENYIFRYLYRLTSDYHAAEELTQETFFREWKRENNFSMVDIDKVELLNKEGPHEVYEKKEKEAVIKEVFERLPEKYREVLWLREWQGK